VVEEKPLEVDEEWGMVVNGRGTKWRVEGGEIAGPSSEQRDGLLVICFRGRSGRIRARPVKFEWFPLTSYVNDSQQEAQYG